MPKWYVPLISMPARSLFVPPPKIGALAGSALHYCAFQDAINIDFPNKLPL